jgi:hypothetical protein
LPSVGSLKTFTTSGTRVCWVVIGSFFTTAEFSSGMPMICNPAKAPGWVPLPKNM